MAMARRVGIAAILAAVCVPGLRAQDIQVCTSSNVAIPVNGNVGDFQLTNFGNVAVGQSRARTFIIRNTDPDTTLTISGFGGNDDPANWTVDQTFTALEVSPGTQTTFDVIFHPAGTGVSPQVIEVDSNDPDFESIYEFPVNGTGVVELPLMANLDIRPAKALTAKLNKKTGLVDAKMKLTVLNTGTSASLAPVVTVVSSTTDVLTLPGNVVFTTQLKPLAAAVGTKVKKKNVNVKLSGLPNADTYFWFLVKAEGEAEADFADSVTSDGFLALTP
jgi:hypothetical protein